MNPFWSEAIRHLAPYRPGEQVDVPRLIKLNTNENPYPPSPAALSALRDAVGADLRLYPDPTGQSLKRTIAAMHGLTPAHVFLGNGSDEVLAHTFLGLLKHALPILVPDISYSFYPVYCGLYDIAFDAVPLDAAFRVRIDDYRRPNGGIILPNPNAPTGIALALSQVRALLAHNRDSVLVIDEAYVDFGADSAVALVREHPQLLVIRTLSKSHGLAGLRVGYALGDPGLIGALDMVKGCFNSYPLDRLALAGAEAALKDGDYLEHTRHQVMASRAWLGEALAALDFEVLPSAANFLFARHRRHAAVPLQAQLRQRHILVRHFPMARIAQFLRISVGTPEQCQALVRALGEIVAAAPQT